MYVHVCTTPYHIIATCSTSLTGKGQVEPPVKRHVGRIAVLPGAHELGVLYGRLGDGGGRCLLAHHADPVVGPRFLICFSCIMNRRPREKQVGWSRGIAATTRRRPCPRV